MKHKIILALWLFIAATATTLQGHDAHYQDTKPRIWETSSGTVIGSFYLVKNDNVLIEEPSGNIRRLSIASLSPKDKDFIAQKQAWIENINQLHKISAKPNEGHSFNSAAATAAAKHPSTNRSEAMIITFVLLALAFLIRFTPKLQPLRFAVPALATVILLTASSFTFRSMKWMGLSTRISFLDSAFSYYKPSISTRSDNNYYYVESLGLPDHEMMIGITAWQQQVPIPQCYVGTNAWSIPMNPTIAATPVPVNQNHFLRGAIALAVNGIPIFNPYTNTGVDAFLDGQLDQYGGHSGRADDYHYHIAPSVLYNKIPKTSPVAFALDGFAIYGNLEPDGSAQKSLDANHGHYGSDGIYHYHSSAAAPYMIGNMVGTVTEDATMQIIPQAAAKGVRPALTPLKGATITHCHPYPNGNGFKLTYTLNADKDTVDYSWTNNGDYTYKFITPAGTTTNNYKGQALCKVTVGNKRLPTSGSWVYVDEQHQLNIFLPGDASIGTAATIYNTRGQIMQNLTLANSYNNIACNQWPAGTYFLVIQRKNDRLQTIKFVIP
ncbi:MAG: YHYH protein [Bacteroidetes bacterium]|nr:YHYH protein [Bacteroidota bacterium]